MSTTIQGKPLCRSFFFDHAKSIIEETHPNLPYSAGLLGYGSDVLGYDDVVSRDHMWGPRFYLFLRREDLRYTDTLMDAFARRLPYTYQGFSTHFTAPDPDDNGVRHARFITEGPVHPLIFITTFDDYLTEQLGTAALDSLPPAMWLAFSEHRLLSLALADWYVDELDCAGRLAPLRFYPDPVKRYLIASCWDTIASEQAFMRRCGDCGDELGSRLVCGRMAERLMRLCFLYRDTYAPYSKWFGTAFGKLDINPAIGQAIAGALSANDVNEREARLIEAQLLTAALHNESGLTAPVEVQAEDYYGRAIRVIFADKLAEAVAETLVGTELAGIPLFGSFSQVSGLSALSDEVAYHPNVAALYKSFMNP